MTYGKFTVTDHNYLNTGGNTMLSIFAVYDSSANVTRWVIANDERFWWQTADTVSSELQIDNDELYDKIVLGEWTWDALVTDPSFDQHLFEDDEWYLFKYCQFEFLKKDCKYFGTKVRLAINELPQDLYIRLTPEYIAWANEEGVGCLTDGYDVFMDDGYEPPVKEDPKELKEMKDFSEWLKALNYDPISFGSYITICIAGNSVKIPLHADSYELLDRFLDKAIEEY
jgi:hypothetical protein